MVDDNLAQLGIQNMELMEVLEAIARIYALD